MTKETTEKEHNQKIGKVIKGLRLSSNPIVTQTKLANSTGVTFQQIQKYEKGTNGCNTYKLMLISKYFNVSINYIFDVAYGIKAIEDRFVKIAEINLKKQPIIIEKDAESDTKEKN